MLGSAEKLTVLNHIFIFCILRMINKWKQRTFRQYPSRDDDFSIIMPQAMTLYWYLDKHLLYYTR